MKKYYKAKEIEIKLGLEMALSGVIDWGANSLQYAIVDYDTNIVSVYSKDGEHTFDWPVNVIDDSSLIEIEEEEFLFDVI